MNARVLCISFVSCILMAAYAEARTWTDASGQFTLEAELVEVLDDKVKLLREDGKEIEVPFAKLSADDQEFANKATANPRVTPQQLTGNPKELKNDDGTPAGKKSFPRGIAAAFRADDDARYLTSVRIHGSRYGRTKAPREDFLVTVCDTDFQPIADFPFKYSRFKRGDNKWVTLRMKPTKVPQDFVICLDFKPERTKGVYVSHDADGESLVGLPKKRAGKFTGGDWMIRPSLDEIKN